MGRFLLPHAENHKVRYDEKNTSYTEIYARRLSLTMQPWQEQIQAWLTIYQSYTAKGHVATYIPALAHANPQALGISLYLPDHRLIEAGDTTTLFTMQSVSKVVNFMAACETRGLAKVLENVDVEPTGDSFDSMIRLEIHKPGKPFNPMINAGAITVAALLPGDHEQQKIDHFLTMMERCIGRKPRVNPEVYASEMKTAHRNRAIAHYLKGSGYLDAEVEDALNVYVKECAVEVTTRDLAKIGLILAHDGCHPITGERIVTKKTAQVTNSLMLTCGMYNASGKTAAFIGIPAKSGVSGGILASVGRRSPHTSNPFPDGCGIGVYGPAIDEYGNSVAGIALLQQLSEAWDMSIFSS